MLATRSATSRRAAHLVVVVGAALLVAVAALPALAQPTTPSRGRTGAEASIAVEVHRFINDERAARGLPALPWAGDLAERATAWSDHMASTGTFAHSSQGFRTPDRWDGTGENIAYVGSPLASALRAEWPHGNLMRSAGHRTNILNTGYEAVGIGVTCTGDRLYVTQVFGLDFDASPHYSDTTPAAEPIVHPGQDAGTSCADEVAEPPAPAPDLDAPPPPAPDPDGQSGRDVLRLAGDNRFATAARAVDPGARTVVVASGGDWPDAVAAAPLAGAGGTLLLVERDRVPEDTARALADLDPQQVLVMGGAAAVADGVVDALAELTGAPVRRVAGPTRLETAVAAAAATTGWDGVVVAHAGQVFDALNAAATGDGPLLLAGPDGLPASALALLEERGARRARLVGTAADPATGVADQLRAAGLEVDVVAPAPADDLSVRLVAADHPAGAAEVLLASATSWPDTLTAAALAVRTGAPLLLADADGSTDWAPVAHLDPARVTVVGGPVAMPDAAVPDFLAR
jgi:uncharacterized protein YkwD